jgi:lipopolysaccharide/colanic/teichoic acid biosynthesis glycosyltransferase
MIEQLSPVQEAIGISLRYMWAKRMLDLCFTLLILIPLCLVIAIAALAIRLDSPGPVFYRQRRVGRHGVEFGMFKLRSMHVNSDDRAHRDAVLLYLRGQRINAGGQGTLAYKQTNDPRVTRVGRFMRKTSIDELPQFFNVLRGEMTLVGPRPPLPYEVQYYSERAWLRLSGKPGLTGVWQVNGRSRVPFHSMVEMDIAYLRRQSLKEDVRLIFLTVPVMIQGRGGA